jgi:HK97 family phage major capsid protein
LQPLRDREEGVGIPSQESALSDAAWTSELANESADTAAPFGKRRLIPHPLVKRIKVSKRLLRSEPNAERWILEAIADAMATPSESKFIQGSGAGEPQGIIGHDDVEVTTTADATAVTVAEVQEWVFSLPARFHRRARILTRPEFIGYLLKLTDADGNPILKGFDGRLWNVPVEYSDGMPEAISTSTWAGTAGEVIAIIGDFRWYWIVDGDELDLARLAELYAEANEVGLQATQYSDGAPVVPAAFRVLQFASS